MKKLYDLVVAKGKYQKNGEEKTRWQNVGVIMEGDKGPFLLLDKTFNPAGLAQPDKETIIISMFQPKDINNQSTNVNNSVAPDSNPFSDSGIPF